MKIWIVPILALLFFACNNGKEVLVLKQQNDSLRLERDSLKSFYIATKYAKQAKVKRDSLRKIKWTFWKKESARMNMSIRVDQGALNHAKQKRKSKREIEEAKRVLAKDEKREAVVRDSVRKYQN
jgi:hypothetical protein